MAKTIKDLEAEIEVIQTENTVLKQELTDIKTALSALAEENARLTEAKNGGKKTVAKRLKANAHGKLTVDGQDVFYGIPYPAQTLPGGKMITAAEVVANEQVFRRMVENGSALRTDAEGFYLEGGDVA